MHALQNHHKWWQQNLFPRCTHHNVFIQGLKTRWKQIMVTVTKCMTTKSHTCETRVWCTGSKVSPLCLKKWEKKIYSCNIPPSWASQTRTSEHCMSEYQGSIQNGNQLPQKFGRHGPGPIYLHNLKLRNLEQQQTCKEDLHCSNSPVENTPEE